MTQRFPDHPFLGGVFAPWPVEGFVHELAVSGELPRQLRGTLYRNGPNPQLPPRAGAAYHWFDGDGMIHAFSFEDERVRYRNRWVRTPRFRRERAAGRSLFGGLCSAACSDPEEVRALPGGSDYERLMTSLDAANTNVVYHGGRLLALLEVSAPHALDPRTLQTLGRHRFDGKLAGGMTAHPKRDPETGELLFFGYSAEPPFLRFHVADAAGRLTRSEVIETPVGTMLHDFAVTREHVIFPQFPATFRPEHLRSGSMVRWEPELGTRIGILPRAGRAAEVRWFEADPCYVYHFMNAHSEGSQLTLDAVVYPRVALFPNAQGGDEGIEAPGLLHRWTLDLASGVLKEECLDDLQVEFPRLDERRMGLSYRFGYAAGTVPQDEDTVPFNAVVRYDHRRGRRDSALFRRGTCSEPVFVPRAPGAAEGEGFLLFTVYRHEQDRSDLVVLDAENAAAEPLATVHLPHRVPAGFHGNWADGVTLAAAEGDA